VGREGGGRGKGRREEGSREREGGRESGRRRKGERRERGGDEKGRVGGRGDDGQEDLLLAVGWAEGVWWEGTEFED